MISDVEGDVFEGEFVPKRAARWTDIWPGNLRLSAGEIVPLG